MSSSNSGTDGSQGATLTHCPIMWYYAVQERCHCLKQYAEYLWRKSQRVTDDYTFKLEVINNNKKRIIPLKYRSLKRGAETPLSAGLPYSPVLLFVALLWPCSCPCRQPLLKAPDISNDEPSPPVLYI